MLYLSPPLPFLPEEKAFVDGLLESNEAYFGNGAHFGRKDDETRDGSKWAEFITFLSLLKKENENVLTEHLEEQIDKESFDDVLKTMGPEWKMEKLRRTWKFANSNSEDPQDKEEMIDISKITKDEHTEIRMIQSFN